MPIQRVQRFRLSDEVVKELKRLIKNQVYPSGSKLPSEKQLAEKFGVSRVSIREALSILSSAKIIEIRHGEGSFVRNTNIGSYLPPVAASLVAVPEHILHLIEVRMTLEVSTAKFAADRATEKNIQEMDDACSSYMQEVQTGGYGEKSDMRFHRAIAAATQNPVFQEMMSPLVGLLRESMRFTLGKNVGNFERVQEVYAEHKRILSAIQNRQPDKAASAMYEHLLIVHKKVAKLISEQDSSK
jgi:GntR family transcriptional regulator, transcriptional repressor for pyruvate dehydrogenase complex